MPPDKLPAAIASWKRDALRRGVAKLYGAKGFVVDDSGSLPEPIAFLSRSSEQSQDSIAVGCISAGGSTAPMAEIQLFWQRMQEKQLKSGVIVTNGKFDPATLEFAAGLPLLMVDVQSLAQAISEIPESQRLSLFQPMTQPVSMSAPVASSSPSPAAAAPKSDRPITPPPQFSQRPQPQTDTPSQMLGAPVGSGKSSPSVVS
ncbi:MAG: restriction endonuclease, partial [Verrucomicrobiota bacterium]